MYIQYYQMVCLFSTAKLPISRYVLRFCFQSELLGMHDNNIWLLNWNIIILAFFINISEIQFDKQSKTQSQFDQFIDLTSKAGLLSAIDHIQEEEETCSCDCWRILTGSEEDNMAVMFTEEGEKSYDLWRYRLLNQSPSPTTSKHFVPQVHIIILSVPATRSRLLLYRLIKEIVHP